MDILSRGYLFACFDNSFMKELTVEAVFVFTCTSTVYTFIYRLFSVFTNYAKNYSAKK